MSIVDDVARMLNPGAFTDWYDGTSNDSKPLKIARQEYERAVAINLAGQILRRVCSIDSKKLKQMLIDDEIDRWKQMGVPADHPECRKIVEQKYAPVK